MKKLFLLAAALIMLGIAPIYAQNAAPGATKVRTAPVKKDGTPDMRYKENKAQPAAAAAPAGPAKKNGTPDMRYKANRDAASRPTNATKVR